MVQPITDSTNPSAFLLILLASLTAFAPFVTDMYLPTLPAMTEFFHTSSSEVQLGLTTSMLGLAIGQLIIGPLSDKYGRKFPLIWTLVFFIISTALCIFASNIQMFVAMRFIQGIGASGGVVLSRSIATDLYQGKPLAKVMAIIGAISGIAPVISPVAGGGILLITSWHGIFALLLAIGVVLLIASFKLKESHPLSARRQMSVLQSFTQITELIKNPVFLVYSAMQFCAMFVFFGQIAASPFIFQTHYGFSEQAFSIFFAANATVLGISAFLTSKMDSPQKCTALGPTLTLSASIFIALALVFNAPVWIFETGMLVLLAGFGQIFAPMTTLAMNSCRKQAGLGSAVFGAAGFISGGIASPLVGLGNIQYTPGIVFIAGTLTTAITVKIAHRIEYKKSQSIHLPVSE